MPTRHRRRSRFTFFLFPLLLIAVSVYFVWQSGRGDYGDEARDVLRQQRATLDVELAHLVAERERLQDRVRRLRVDALDADLLDERARAQLNMAHPNEIVILNVERDPSPEPAAKTGMLMSAHGN
ncbi:septum formation initiator family protein [Acuticoccus sp. I52.16.1]|uniref:FtsB family cell division protein n=1 Tax=Acuticoccus sp. I52.16.1 TaxID=2928472 RepID=UPI001FD0668D|nr:septum formation initiator family protein [Acuticoccus sp. I52.16.1]UOM34593.1 septum formation initiator family protein [Acuticoccus sp. I52.16.1]